MFGSFGRTVLRGLIAVVTLSPLFLSVGCADVITYARQSRNEGLSLYKQKAYPDAAGAFRNAVRQDPRDYESHYWLGMCYDQMQLHQQAFSSYRAAMDILPNTYGGRNDDEFRQVVLDGYAQSIAKFDQHDIELNVLEKQAEKTQRSQEYFVLAKVYRLRGDADSAIRCYKAATHWSPNDFVIRKEFGMYLYEPLHQNGEARVQLGLAYRLDSNDKDVIGALQALGALPTPKLPSSESPAASQARTVTPRTVAAPRD